MTTPYDAIQVPNPNRKLFTLQVSDECAKRLVDLFHDKPAYYDEEGNGHYYTAPPRLLVQARWGRFAF